MSTRSQKPIGDIAILGMSGRFPGASDLNEFWSNLARGTVSIAEVPKDRWDGDAIYSPDPKARGKSLSKWGGFISNVDEFDPRFFRVTPNDAVMMDPQQRLFLEESWKAFENAGFGDRDLDGARVGVFVGCKLADYLMRIQALGESVEGHVYSGNDVSMMPARLSYFLNLRGPSMPINTACSSSLVAMHLACESLLSGTCEMALVAGVELMTSPGIFYALSSAGAIAPGPECRVFDEGANGVVLGEGVCAVVLKPLDAALRDGDPIRGVIKGVGINQDGRSSGITAPNGAAQAALIEDVYRRSGVHPETLAFVEAHGTGTPVGDPIEIHALTQAFRKFTDRRRFCPIASLKANIGHPISAAGLAGVIKILLAFEHGQIPPAVSFSRESSRIDFETSPFFVNSALRPFETNGPRRAAVSAFGLSGTNAHAVLEEAPSRARRAPSAGPEVVFLSAKNDEALGRRIAELRAWLEADGGRASLADIAATLHRGRSHFPHRVAIVADSTDDLARKLGAAPPRRHAPTVHGEAREALRAADARIGGALRSGALDGATRRGALVALGELYVRGHLPASVGVGERIVLPPYSFARERYWIAPPEAPSTKAPEATAAVAAPAAAAELPRVRPAGELRFGDATWVDAPQADGAMETGSILVFSQGESLAGEIAARSGRHVILVEPHVAFAEVSPDRFFVRPAGGDGGADFAAVLAALPGGVGGLAGVVFDWSAETYGEADEGRMERVGASIFALVRALATASPRRWLPILVGARAEGGVIDPLAFAMSGLGHTLEAEAPSLKLRVVATESGRSLRERAAILVGELGVRGAGGAVLRYEAARRFERRIVLPPSARPEASTSPLRRGAVCIVTGGAGGIGVVVAEHLARTLGARIVLTGRSAESDKTSRAIERVRARGGEAIYVRADVGQRADVERLVGRARERFGAVHAVLHAAGVHRDALVRNKERSDLDVVLRPKVLGTTYLDEATSGDDLDLFALFSSLASLKGNPGQSDYASGNAFLDGFAPLREARRAAGARRGHTVSINWPYWEDGGMRLTDEDVEAIRRYAGLLPMPTEVALRALDHASSGASNRVVIYGEQGRLDGLFQELPAAAPPAARVSIAPASAVAEGALLRAAEETLRGIMAEATHLTAGEIDPRTSFGEYGVDSVTIKSFNLKLDAVFGTLPRTLLFEHDNLESLASYLATHHAEALRTHLGDPAPAPALAPPAPVLPPPAPVPMPDAHSSANEVAYEARRTVASDIAIIGISGRYPGADDLDAFWNNLRGGVDSVGEIPEGRFDPPLRYDPDPDKSRDGWVYCKWGGMLEQVDTFDARFFSISPREAEIMDPQERLLLETAWATFEAAGYTRERLRALDPQGRGCSVGVFAGVTTNTYALHGPEQWAAGRHVFPVSAPWSIANRISYLLDLAGPSLVVDTACSSSLVAIHLAVQSLRKGECKMALVGGVNVYLHRSKYIGMCQVRMLSPTGRSRAFGDGADGFVPGEGVGCVLLKPLEAALREGDTVRAVIKGTAVNHGGKTHSYSVPNPNAQADLVREALSDARVDARTISYVEAHGTGTALGDPIELRGLSNAFRAQTQEAGFCALGSLKSNIGHLEAAAGIAGLTKLVLQLEHGEIAPSLFSERLNPDLQIEGTPFYVATRAEPWRAAPGVPRRAGLSSFGAGGTNAHIIVEEAPAVTSRVSTVSAPALILLSAKSEQALRAYARSLLTHVHRHPELAIDDVAFTLQLGREAMPHRLALVAPDRDGLVRALEDFVAGTRAGAAGSAWVQGHATGKADTLAGDLLDGEEGRIFVREAIERGRWAKLGRLWAHGASIDWTLLHAGRTPRCVPLPTYPFERKRYWIESVPSPSPSPAAAPEVVDASRAHTIRTTLRGDEFFLRDHIIDGRPSLPGVAVLEIARAAGEQAMRRPVSGMRQVVWVKPIVVVRPREVRVTIAAKEGEADFEVRSSNPGEPEELHARGRLVFGPTDGARSPVDLDAIVRRCTQVRASDVYPSGPEAEAFVRLGPALRSIVVLRTGEGEALSELVRPASVGAEANALVLDASILDGALQTAIMLIARRDDGKLFFPFSIDAVDVVHALPARGRAHVRVHERAASGILKVDIDVLGETGAVHASLKGVAFRIVDRPDATPPKPRGPQPPEAAPILYAPEWAPSSAAPGPVAALGPTLVLDEDSTLAEALARGVADPVALAMPGASFAASGDARWVIPPGDSEALGRVLDELAARGRAPACIVCAWGEGVSADDESTLLRQLDRGLHTAFAVGRALAARPALRAKLLLVHRVAKEGAAPALDATAGWTAAASLEGKNLSARTVVVAGAVAPAALATIVPREFAAQAAPTVLYRGESRFERRLRLVDQDANASSSHVNHSGAIVIAGGTGTLGRIVAAHLARTRKAPIALVARSTSGTRSDDALRELRALGVDAMYVQADLARGADVARALEAVRARFGAIVGVVHAAGSLTEGYLADRTRDRIDPVVLPKVLGAFHLDRETRGDSLDFFVALSSTSGELGNPAQTDYAYASAFLDAFAVWRNEQVRNGSRRGRSVTLDGSLWSAGGIGAVDPSVITWLRDTMGMETLSNGIALAAFERALAGVHPRVLVFSGDRARIARTLAARAVGTREPETTAGSGGALAAEDQVAALAVELRGWAAELLKLDPAEVEFDAELSEFGFESVALIEFANVINQRYGLELMPTVFFDHRSIGSLARHIAEIAPHLGSAAAAPVPEPRDAAPTIAEPAVAEVTVLPVSHRAEITSPEPVAIVGISGAMPQSRDLGAFWEHLREGHHLITEVPPSRWDWRLHGEATRWGGFMPDVDTFDPLFFNISPREAALMDPQHRLFLLHAWAAIENAGHSPKDFAGTRTAVFVGVQSSDYAQMVRERLGDLEPHAPIGNSFCMMPNRVSFLLDLHGPSEPIDTGCSSALIAIERAVRAIQSGCDAAIAGGVSVMLSPMPHLFFSKAGVLSKDHRCRAFDKQATGTVRGEGVGALLLRPLSRAIADKDPIYAIVRGAGQNHGGRSHSLTAPNPSAQADLIEAVHTAADLDPERLEYLEAHGTGTTLGDPIEVNGLKKAFANLYRRRGKQVGAPHIALASVKTNVGHLEPSAGLAGVFKVLLAMKHGLMPANLHFEGLNPYIDLTGTPFHVPSVARAWPRQRDHHGAELPRVAAVSSFGMGGANAHVILEDVPVAPEPAQDAGPQIVVLSAQSEERLRAYAEALADHVAALGHALPAGGLEDLAYTTQVGRAAMAVRLAIVASDGPSLLQKLAGFVRGEGRDSEWFSATADSKPAPAAPGSTLADIARAWTRGASVDFRALHTRTPRRMPLPSYPFARVRCWLDGPAEAPSAPVHNGAVTNGTSSNGVTPHAEPADAEATLARLKRLVASQLDVDPSILREDEPLVGYGMDSINLATFARRVADEFGEGAVDFSVPSEPPTLRSIAEHLARKRVEPAGTPRSRAATEPPSEMVAISPAGRKTSSFWVPGSFGFVESFKNLASALGPDHSVFAFRARGNDGKRAPFTRVEDMAKEYVTLLRQAQPHGPYIVGGYSFGGIVALEMAQLLARQGARVKRLVLLDAYAPGERTYRMLHDSDWTDIMHILANYMTGHGESSTVITRADLQGVPSRMYLAELARLSAERGRTGLTHDEIFQHMRGALEVSEFAAEMVRTYVPAPYEASEVSFFRSKPGSDAYVGDYDYIAPWRDLAGSRLHIVECPVSHGQMTSEEALRVVLPSLAASLAQEPFYANGAGPSQSVEEQP